MFAGMTILVMGLVVDNIRTLHAMDPSLPRTASGVELAHHYVADYPTRPNGKHD